MKRVTLTPEQVKRFERAYWITYNNIAGDAWGERIPSLAVFRDALADHVEFQSDLKKEEIAVLRSLPRSVQHRLMGRP
jgi:hypothetical protein